MKVPLRWLIPAILLVPLGAGLLGTFFSAFNLFFFQEHLPPLASWQAFWEHPSTSPALWLTVRTSLLATALSLLGSGLLLSLWQDPARREWLRRTLLVPLALPHATVAIFLVLLWAPAGLFWRLWASPADLPPELTFPGDSWGWSLVLGLTLKELPFLLLLQVSLQGQFREVTRIQTARLLGKSAWWAWWITVFPTIYSQIRLPIWAVLAFSVGVVDVALILGPSTPPPFAVLLLQWANDPLLEQQSLAAVGSLFQVALTLSLVFGWWMLERMIALLYQLFSLQRKHSFIQNILNQFVWIIFLLASGIFVAGLAAVGIWSVARRWPFPHLLPTEWSLLTWERHNSELSSLLGSTLSLGLGSTIVALLLTLLWLHTTSTVGWSRAWWIYLPLLLPPFSFLFGVHVLVLWLRWEGAPLLLIWGHLLYVMPYIFLLLEAPWQRNHFRFWQVGQMLGQSRLSQLWRIQLPLLRSLLWFACAVGFSVSVAQYLPTLLLGAGRWSTLTTEAIALASGQDRRVLSLLALWQTLLPAFGFAIAIWMQQSPQKPRT